MNAFLLIGVGFIVGGAAGVLSSGAVNHLWRDAELDFENQKAYSAGWVDAEIEHGVNYSLDVPQYVRTERIGFEAERREEG